MKLAALLQKEHRGPLAADFRHYYGLSPLRDMSKWGIPLTELAAYAVYLPPDSATMRTVDPDAWITPEIQLLSHIERGVRVLDWRKTKDGHDGRNPPSPLPLTVAEKNARRAEAAKNGDIPFETTTKDDMRRLLGW